MSALVLLLLALLFALPREATAAVNCAQILPTDLNIKYCEDFESPTYNQGSTCTRGVDCGWTDKYGAPVDGCWTAPFDHNAEGTCATCCYNMVQEGACEVPGQTGCVFQGTQAFGHRFHPGATQGNVGSRAIGTGTNFGVTMAVKFSNNFYNTDAPKKTDEFGPSGNCILGCSSGTIVSPVAGNPYHASFFMNSAISGMSVVKGLVNSDSTGFRWAANVPAGQYDFNRDFGVGTWHCRQMHITGVGQAGARIRDWMDGTLLVDVQNVDLSKMHDASAGLNSITFDNYVNGGYGGSSIAYRYEDNIVVTSSAEPVPCSVIGFGGSSPSITVTGVTPATSTGNVTLSTGSVVVTYTNNNGATGNATISIDCGSGSNPSPVTGASPVTVPSACSYATPGTYTLTAGAVNGSLTSSGTATITATTANSLTVTSVTATPSTGTAPVTSTIAATFIGTGTAASGTATLSVDCDLNGSKETTASGSSSPLSVSCTGLPVGANTVNVQVARGAVTGTGSVTVTGSPAVSGPPTIAFSPTSITHSAVTGVDATDKTFTLQNTGTGTLNYTVTTDRAWVTTTPTSGTVAASGSTTITIHYGSAALPALTYGPSVFIQDANATNNNAFITTFLTVADAPASTLTITSVTATPNIGSTPLTSVLSTAVSGTATGTITVSADCDGDGVYETTGTGASSPVTLSCTFTTRSPDGKVVYVIADRGSAPTTARFPVVVYVSAPDSPNRVIFNRSSYRAP